MTDIDCRLELRARILKCLLETEAAQSSYANIFFSMQINSFTLVIL